MNLDSIAQRLAQLDITITRTRGDTVRLSDEDMGTIGRAHIADVAYALDAVDRLCGDSATFGHRYAVFHGRLRTI